jgi:hypothetical protein
MTHHIAAYLQILTYFDYTTAKRGSGTAASSGGRKGLMGDSGGQAVSAGGLGIGRVLEASRVGVQWQRQ